MPHQSNTQGVNPTVLLRQITIFSFPASAILLIVHLIASHYVFPGLGILPLAGSFLLGALLLHRDRVAALGSPVHVLSPSNIFFADTILVVLYLGFLIPTFILLNQPRDRSLVALGAYSSVPMMLNLLVYHPIHCSSYTSCCAVC